MFFIDFNMADTFFSWFLITELHVWMIMVRYMADEQNGRIVRNNAVGAMWEDTKARVEKLGVSKIIFLILYVHIHYHNFVSIIASY